MNKIEDLRVKIERERARLNQLITERRGEETLEQSVLVDRLIEEYMALTNE